MATRLPGCSEQLNAERSRWEAVSFGKMTPIDTAANVIVNGRIRSAHRGIRRSGPRDRPIITGYSGSIIDGDLRDRS